MIFSIIASLYITGICWSWGKILLRLLKKISGDPVLYQTGFAITCFCGLAAVTVFCGFLSLFLPLGGAVNQLWLIVPVGLFAWRNPGIFSTVPSSLKRMITSFHPALLLSLAISIMLSLIMSAGEIIHPDTLHYHAQCIQWIEAYKVVPGLANIGYHFGLQSSWFVGSAIFALKFTGSHAPTFLNTAVIIWFILFIHLRIHACLANRDEQRINFASSAMWILLFIFSFWSFTQVRATLSSSSPDFIVTLYTWLVFYLVFQFRKSSASGSLLMLIFFLGCFSLTIKLSGAPAALFAAFIYVVYAKKNWTMLVGFSVLGLLTVSPFITRNIITSGYPLFPSTALDIFPAEWKVPRTLAARQSAFIKAYARVGDNTTTFGDEAINRMPSQQWLKMWWQKRALSNKLIIAAFIGLVLLHLVLIKKIQWKNERLILYSLSFSLFAIILWFIEAPDPRFGFGYIIPAEALLIFMLLKQEGLFPVVNKKLVVASVFLFSMTLAGYSCYRLIFFFKSDYLVNPAGTSPISYQTKVCRGIGFNIPADSQCGSNPLPCIYYSCSEFFPRGRKITDGFIPGKVK